MAKLNNVKVIDMVGGEVTKIAYRGAEYSKVESPEKGDIAVIVEPWELLVAGEYFRVKEPSTFGGKNYVDIGGGYVGYDTDMKYFRKVNAQPCSPSAPCASLSDEVQALGNEVGTLTQRVMKLEEDAKQADAIIEGGHTLVPQVGDKIRIVAATNTSGKYENGDVLTVESVDSGNGVYVEEHGRVIFHEEFIIIELPEKPALSVGDYAKVVDDNNINNGGSIKAGEVVEIIEDDNTGIPYRIKSVTTGVTVWAKPSHIVKATDEEVAEAQEKAAEIEKFVKIGRKPGEIKDGDIVKLNRYSGAHSKGAIVEVVKGGWYRDSEGDTYGGNYSWYELITPVEHRFDK